jgi:signal transduction histidine kinase
MATSALTAFEGMIGGLAPRWSGIHVPAQGTLDDELHRQRLGWVGIYSLGIGVFGLGWGIAFVSYGLLSGGLDRVTMAVSLQAGVLSTAGWWASSLCRRGRLRPATYMNFAALLFAATANLACTTNAEGVAVITYGVAMSLAAMVIEGREWLWVTLVLSGCALLGSLLHSFPLIAQGALPDPVAIGALLCTATLGLAVPAALFWLFSANLTASRAEAWALAREAADAQQLATDRARQLERRTEQLQAKNAELNDFLYVVSHDLRAPLINLEGFSRTLQEDLAGLGEVITGRDPTVTLTPQAAWAAAQETLDESLDFIVRSVAKMDFLVRGLLELSRIDNRPHVADRVDVERIVDDVFASMQFNIAARGIAVRVDPLPAVTGDALRISQVFGNLIDNAIKYTKPEGEAHIRVGCETRDGDLHFFVRDTGIGIRAEDQVKIFRLFTRIGSAGVAGDGMGLTAVKKILEKHGGKIWVESAPGRGSTFWFTLPPAAGQRTEDDGAG